MSACSLSLSSKARLSPSTKNRHFFSFFSSTPGNLHILTEPWKISMASSGSNPKNRVIYMQEIKAASGSNLMSNPNPSNLEELSPCDLVKVSQKLLAEGNVAKAEAMLKLALAKDPEYHHGLMAMSSLLMLKGQFADALKFLDRVISKPCPEHPLHFSDARIVAPQMAATCCINLGKLNEAFGFLEPLARMTEPENPIANGNYFEGIGMLGGISFDFGRIDDAVKCEKMMFAKIGPARYARRISHLPTRYGEFVKSLKYVLSENTSVTWHETRQCATSKARD